MSQGPRMRASTCAGAPQQVNVALDEPFAATLVYAKQAKAAAAVGHHPPHLHPRAQLVDVNRLPWQHPAHCDRAAAATPTLVLPLSVAAASPADSDHCAHAAVRSACKNWGVGQTELLQEAHISRRPI